MKDIQSDITKWSAELDDARHNDKIDRLALREKYKGIMQEAGKHQGDFDERRRQVDEKIKKQQIKREQPPGMRAVIEGLRQKAGDQKDKRYDTIVDLWESAEAGSVSSQQKMAEMLMQGVFKVPDAADEALRLLLKGVDVGDATSAMRAAKLLEEKSKLSDCEQCLRKALECYRMAAASGIEVAGEIAKIIEEELDETFGIENSNDPVAIAQARSKERRENRKRSSSSGPGKSTKDVSQGSQRNKNFNEAETIEEMMSIVSLSGTWESANRDMMEATGEWPNYAAKIHTPRGTMSGRIAAKVVKAIEPGNDGLEQFLSGVIYEFRGTWQLGDLVFQMVRPNLDTLVLDTADLIGGALGGELPELIQQIQNVVARQENKIVLKHVLRG